VPEQVPQNGAARIGLKVLNQLRDYEEVVPEACWVLRIAVARVIVDD
jgi:hypothetical protein